MEVTIMNITKSSGILAIILGLFCILFPVFFESLISIIVGASLLIFGVLSLIMALNMKSFFENFSKVTAIVGIIGIIFGFLFLFYIDALSFLVAIEFYLVGILMIIFGISGLLARMDSITNWTSILVLIMGIVSIVLAVFSLSQPVYIAMIIGIVLIIQGATLFLSE